jgi:hypothetical protein
LLVDEGRATNGAVEVSGLLGATSGAIVGRSAPSSCAGDPLAAVYQRRASRWAPRGRHHAGFIVMVGGPLTGVLQPRTLVRPALVGNSGAASGPTCSAR